MFFSYTPISFANLISFYMISLIFVHAIKTYSTNSVKTNITYLSCNFDILLWIICIFHTSFPSCKQCDFCRQVNSCLMPCEKGDLIRSIAAICLQNQPRVIYWLTEYGYAPFFNIIKPLNALVISSCEGGQHSSAASPNPGVTDKRIAKLINTFILDCVCNSIGAGRRLI